MSAEGNFKQKWLLAPSDGDPRMFQISISGAMFQCARSCKHVASSNAAFTDLPNGHWYADS